MQIQELLNGVSFKAQHEKTLLADPEYRYVYYSLKNPSAANLSLQDALQQNQLFDSNMTILKEMVEMCSSGEEVQQSQLPEQNIVLL